MRSFFGSNSASSGSRGNNFRVTICHGVNGNDENEKPFFPSGAISFFVVLLVFYALLWLVIYGLMIARS